MRIKIFLIPVFLCMIFLYSSAQKSIYKINCNLEDIQDSIPWMNAFSITDDSEISGNKYSSTDSAKPYGFGYKGAFPEKCRNKSLTIKFSQKLRASEIGKEFGMVFSVSIGDSVIVWNFKNCIDKINQPSKWTTVEESVDVPASMTSEKYTLSAYLWNKDGRIKADMDDLEIDFIEKKLPSFFPKIPKAFNGVTGWSKIISSGGYTFVFNGKAGAIRVLNASGDTLFKSFSLYSEWMDSKKQIQNSLTDHFKLIEDTSQKDGRVFQLSASNEISENEIIVYTNNENGLTFKTNTRFTKPVSLYRQSLIATYTGEITRVFKKNTLEDSVNLKPEYWINKEGFILSNGNNALTIYHPEKISSMQLDINNKCFVVNLDYAPDHPLLHFPLLKKSENRFEDYSTSIYKRNEKLEGSFTFYQTSTRPVIPRMMTNQYGYQSSFIWTEHADYTNLRTHKAVYYGSENIESPEKATGGFIKYSIPVTKSVFYANPDKVDNAEKSAAMPGPVANYKETKGFDSFLKQLEESGMELCLHTPDHYTCDRKLLEEALEVTRRYLSPVSWIDHAYDNSEKSNREDLNCDGADSLSKWYSADLWKKYGLKYFWNSYFEDSAVFANYTFNSFFSAPYTGWDDAFPAPQYWRNVTRTEDMVHWGTSSTLDLPDGSLWSYFFNDVRLTDLVNNRNNVVVHCYPARVDSTNGFYEIEDGEIRVNEEFNHALEKLSTYRSKEKIRLMTIREMLDFRTSLENISYQLKQDGSISVTNTGKGYIRGVSFSAEHGNFVTDKKDVMSKVDGNEFIFWFDIAPGEIVSFKMSK